jgi:hypothetical protein
MSLAHTPFPHAEYRLLRDRVTGLARQHGDLSAAVRLVRDQSEPVFASRPSLY